MKGICRKFGKARRRPWDLENFRVLTCIWVVGLDKNSELSPVYELWDTGAVSCGTWKIFSSRTINSFHVHQI